MDRSLAAVARRQHGVFTLRQAVESGVSHAVVRRRVRAGEWERVFPRVLRVAASPVTWHQDVMALTLATGGHACDRSAAALYGLVPPGPVEVVVPRSGRPRGALPGVRSTASLAPFDLASVDGIPATTPTRTLVDLIRVLPVDVFESILDAALVRGLVTRDRLERRARALRRGAVVRLLDDRHPQMERARNDWEALVLRLCRRYRLPDPVPNHPVVVGGRRREIDAAWPEQQVALELDGFVPHSSRRTFDDDRVRQNDLVDAGWRVFRLTVTGAAQRPGPPRSPPSSGPSAGCRDARRRTKSRPFKERYRAA